MTKKEFLHRAAIAAFPIMLDKLKKEEDMFALAATKSVYAAAMLMHLVNNEVDSRQQKGEVTFNGMMK